MTPTCTCPCGAPITSTRNRKFCSRSCAGTHGGGHRPASKFCRACGWLMDDGGVYVDKAGHRRCRRCVIAAGRADYVPGPKGSPRPKAASRPRAVPAPVRVEPAVPVWRPPGWAPVPAVGRRAS